MTIDELLGLLDMQEEILQFSHFTNADAWEVGNCIVAESIKRKPSERTVASAKNEYRAYLREKFPLYECASA